MALAVSLPKEQIAELYGQNGIRKLCVYGSVLTGRFRPDSDVDMLVEFEGDARPTLLTLARIERELSELVGRTVDLRMPTELSRYFRESVEAVAVPQYERV